MNPLAARVARAIERGGLVPPGARVLVAVSGGSDSVALLLLLREIAASAAFTVAGLAHLNHLLRGAASDDDEAFCRELAGTLDLPIEVERTDVGSLARVHRVSIEVAARRARYRCLERAAARLDADVIATGHTRDDQAETFLLRLLRGAGATGLAGIPPRRETFVRPLLDERRADLRVYLAECGATFRDDASNDDTTIPRNWVRHDLMPLLAARLGGDLTDVLAREATLLRDDGALLDDLAAAAAGRILGGSESRRVELDADDLRSLPPAIARRVVRRALARVSPAFQGADHVLRVLDLASASAADSAKGQATIDLPGARVERNPRHVVLTTREGRGFRPSVSFRHPLPVPGYLVIEEAGTGIRAEPATAGGPEVLDVPALRMERVGVIDAQAAVGGLWVRSRRPGDTVRPLGLGRRRKLQNVFVDRKVPRNRRDLVPLVVDDRDRIVWIPGVGPSEDARVTEHTQSVVILEVNSLGDTG